MAEEQAVAQPDGAGGTPALPGADAAASAKPAVPAKPTLPPPELSAGGRAAAEAIGALGLSLGYSRPDSWGNPMFDVEPQDLLGVGRALRDRLDLTYLACLAPLDWPDRWEVAYHLYDFAHRTWIALVTKIPKDQLEIPSVTGIWPAANWYEREGYDMYGITFADHPHLCRILMSDDWQTFPLRKDHPMDLEGGY